MQTGTSDSNSALEITDIISRISSVIEKRKQELSALDNLIKARYVVMMMNQSEL